MSGRVDVREVVSKKGGIDVRMGEALPRAPAVTLGADDDGDLVAVVDLPRDRRPGHSRRQGAEVGDRHGRQLPALQLFEIRPEPTAGRGPPSTDYRNAGETEPEGQHP